jgi:drug/metabolite transporter (DMT)-like permease
MFSASTCYFLGLATMPLANAVALYFASPIFVTLLSALALGERVGASRWVAVLVGFLGITLVLSPGRAEFEPAALLPLYAGFAYAVSAIIARRQGRTDTAPVMAFYANAIFLLGGLVLGAVFTAAGLSAEGHPSLAFLVRAWHMPGPSDLALLVAGGILATLGAVLLAEAYRLAQASALAPYEYSSIAWGVAFGWLFWDEVPGPLAWAGIALVVAAGLTTLRRRERPAPAPDPDAALPGTPP